MVGGPEPEEPFHWDWVLVLLIVLAVLFVAVLTFELWAPHPPSDR